MNTFSISELQQFSGIKAHTIRIWEQRYNALKPSRSEGNTRYYDNSQLRRLLNISSLIDSRIKISELCKMSDKEHFELIDERLNETIVKGNNSEYYITQLLSAAMAYDEKFVEKILSNCILRLGMRTSYIEVIYPMLSRVGLLWSMDKISPSQEHFMSNIIKQKLFSSIDALPPPLSESNAWLLFLPEDEYHELGLLFAQYILRSAGIKTVYLGSNVPTEVVTQVASELKIKNILFFFIHNIEPSNATEMLNKLSTNSNKQSIYVSGNASLISTVKLKKNMHWIKSVEDLEQSIKN